MSYQQSIVQQIIDRQKQIPGSYQTKALNVHYNNYLETGINALSINFPTLSGLLEQQDFRRLCQQYLVSHPKTTFDWADYGHDLDTFILEIEALSTQPFLKEVATLDAQLQQIEKLKDGVVDHASFERMQHDEFSIIGFVAGVGLSINKALFPIVELYQLVHEFNTSSNKATNHARENHLKKLNILINDAIKFRQFRSIVLWREQYKARFTYCDERAYQAYLSVIRDESIEQVFSHFQDDESALTTWLQTSIQNYQIIGIKSLL